MLQHVHLIGIGGAGLSAIAQVLLESGYEVSGSDRSLSPFSDRVEQAGGRVYAGHRPEQVQGADLVVRSSAIPDTNVEVQAALQAGIPVLKRADFLGRLMAGQVGIAVAGTHGKTTTTAMIAWMLAALDQDPSYIIGGVSANLGRNAHAGQGRYFVIEADEYDRMFLGLTPQIAVVTNVEHDHPDCYPTPEVYRQAFQSFTALLPPTGLLLACLDDPAATHLAAETHGPAVRTYGLSSQADYQALDLQAQPGRGYRFVAARKDGTRLCPAPVDLQAPGLHNVRNALAALAVADHLSLPLERAAQALGEYQGTGRRFELRGEVAGVTLIDDYAHHPTEIRATLAAARARYPQARLWAVWQPHTYSRTRALFADFCAALREADRVVVLAIYAARETAPEDGFSSAQIAAALGPGLADYAPDFEAGRAILLQDLQPGDVVLVLSAGDADQLTGRLLTDLAEA